MIQEVTDTSITEILQNNENALVMFSSPTCAPCRMMTPVLEAISNENKDKFIGKVDVTISPEARSAYDITSVPTTLIFKNGKLVDKKIGIKSKKEFQTLLDSL